MNLWWLFEFWLQWVKTVVLNHCKIISVQLRAGHPTNKLDLSYVTESTDDEQWHQIKVWAFRDYSTSVQLGSDLLNIFPHWVRKPCTLQCRLKCSRRDCRCLSGCHRSKPQRFRSASTLPCIMYWPRVIIGTFWSFLRLLYFLVLFVSRRMSQVETTVAEVSQRKSTSLYCALATTGHRSPVSHTGGGLCRTLCAPCVAHWWDTV